MIAAALGQCRRALLEAGPAVVGAAALAAYVGLAQDGGAPAADAPAVRWPREAAPLVAALVACGSLAAARAGELARLRLEGQLDALRAMGGSAWRHLVAPRLLAGALALPLLVLLAAASGLGVAYLDWAPRAARWTASEGVALADLAAGLGRGALYGTALALVACVAGLGAGRVASERQAARAAARAGAGGVVAVLALHAALGGCATW